MNRHINIPLFIPHLGCPNNCVFCNQRKISGKCEFIRENVASEIETVLSTISESNTEKPEIAFFGGSFTGIERGLMIYLLEVAEKYVREGRVGSIRLSTRPDYIDEEILDLLGLYSVKTVELGIQSTDDMVLAASKRGHDAKTALNACRAVKEHGFTLIGQMMTGLPGADGESEIRTARDICNAGADGARVYPTVVFYETELCDMAKAGLYSPLTTDEAVIRTKNVLAVFAEHNIPVIRVGLCASENLSSPEAVYGGANHSAIGELAMGELFYDILDKKIGNVIQDGCKRVIVSVPKSATSKVIGQKRKNSLRIIDKYRLEGLKVLEKEGLTGYEVIVCCEY